MPLASDLLASLAARRWSLAVAESLTGGLVCAALVDVPGASRVLRGAVVAYATDLKGALLDVDRTLLDVRGAVDPDVVAAMATGVRHRLGADVGLATTGVAGPGPQDGRPPGTVYVAVCTPDGTHVRSLRLAGDRARVRAQAVDAVLSLGVEIVRDRGESASIGGRSPS
ncbi:CinA family protein [Cellulomonas fengjieae]|uniref:CinA family protein n=1 Tax=Cellulomonas fengjieae TaxID=2819978 RepID=A0ABS3SF53_9CELL|nr:CinA family protein [Cellulomonas fengjieae]MBO3084375.1 CinA family protein [Cellulomonas fengjieae]MBO3103147.1 CinA family protein [Cellulomonas fengjieae]QVI67278.1 CinA family protein [Cellulomonas fengjieae]